MAKKLTTTTSHSLKSNNVRTNAPDYVLAAYMERQEAISQRLNDFLVVPPTEWFYELCFCLCTPQSKAVHAAQVVDTLKLQGFQQRVFDPTSILRDPSHYIRFHNTKSRNLVHMRENYLAIEYQLASKDDVVAKRAWLVKNVKGMGMKEASHFLRNIGYRNIAILDRHILRHLLRCEVTDDATFPSSISRYEEIERRWQRFASDIRIDMDELDLLFWSLETGEILK